MSERDDDRDLARRAIADVGRRVRHAPPEGLNHPLVAQRRFGEELDRAQAAAPLPVDGRASQLLARPFADLLDAQRQVNDALIQALHQLDHRARLQEHRITELEDELARRRDAGGNEP